MANDHGLYELVPLATNLDAASPQTPKISVVGRQNQVRRKPVPENNQSGYAVSTGPLTRWKLFIDRYWIYELFSCLLALAALASIIGALDKFNGRPNPEWPSVISINTLIATLTAILKASLLLPVTEGISELKWAWFRRSRPLIDISVYDSASRGPWGSFLFLVSRKPDFLASLGALIIVFALAIDPFSQQVIKYENCLQPVGPNTAQISRTNNYSTGGIHEAAGLSSLDGPMTLAIYNGLLSPPTDPSSQISIQCSSGNCTFPSTDDGSYSSLAMCYEVQDISRFVQSNGSRYNDFTLPSGALLTDAVQMSTITPGYYYYNATARYPPLKFPRSSIFMFEALMYSCENPIPANYDCNSTFAFRTSVYPCMKTYGANITGSILTETAISSMLLSMNAEESWVLYLN